MKLPTNELIKVLNEKGFSCEEVGVPYKPFSRWGWVFEKKMGQAELLKEITVITSSATKIVNFLGDLLNKGKDDILEGIFKVEINYFTGNEFRGSGSGPSYIYLAKEVAEKIQLKGYFRWIDMGWGDFEASLEYELS